MYFECRIDIHKTEANIKMKSLYPICILYVMLGLIEWHTTLADQSNCNKPLGLEKKTITDKQFKFTESSYYPGYEPYKGRLNKITEYCTPPKNKVYRV